MSSNPILPDQTPKRRRNRSAEKGSAFERMVADWLKSRLGDDRIDRRVKHGVNDRGDITGVRTAGGGRVVIECKAQNRLTLAEWVDEAELERGNDDAVVGVVVHRRRGKGASSFGETYVSMTLESFARLLDGGFDE